MEMPAVCIQVNAEWLDALISATERLEYTSTWQDGADMDAIRGQVSTFLDYLVDVRDCAAGQPPFWDDTDASDADDEAPISGSTWYEDIADVIVTAFLATSFTPGAAIKFVTTARKFRLLFRSRNYGAIANIFLDGLFQTAVDTYAAAPGITAVDIVVPPGMPAAVNLRIEHSGAHNPAATATAAGYGLEVIRKRLSEDEMGIQDVRLSAGNIQVQRTINGAWENITGGEVVRRDGTLDPDLQGDLSVSGGAINVRAPNNSTYGVFASSNGEFRLGSSNGGQSNAIIRAALNAPADSVSVSSTRLASTLDTVQRKQTSTGTGRDAAAIRSGWLDNTDATRRAFLDILALDAVNERRGLRIGTDGTQPIIGFLGAAGIVRPTLTGGDGGVIALRNLIDRLEDFGLLVDATTEETAEAAFTGFTEDQRCRVAYGVAYLWRQHAITFRDALEANAATLNAVDPSTYDPVMAAFPPGWTDYNAARQWLIDRTVDWSTDVTPPPSNFAGWLNSLENWLDIELFGIQCALYRVMPAAAYLSEIVVDAWRDELALTIQPPLDALTYFFQGLMDYTNRAALGALVNAATALGVDEWDCLDCLPGILEFNFEGAASNTLEGATVDLYVVLNASAGGATGSPIDVNITIGGGTATAADYTLLTPVVTFPAGSVHGARQLVQIAIASDADTGDNETIIVDLSPESGSAGTTAQHTLTIIPGGIGKAWLQDFIFSTANGMQGWTLENGTLDPAGILDENIPGEGEFADSAIINRTITIPHSSTVTTVLVRPYVGGGSRHVYIDAWGENKSYPPTSFPTDGTLSFGWTTLAKMQQTGIVRINAGNQGGSGRFDWVRFQGTGINPFTGT